MSDLTPELVPGDGDTPGPVATPAQDSDVRALLGTLRAEDVPMPDDVVRRINAAIVAEHVAASLPDSPAALVDGSDARTSAAGGTVTVLPSAEQRRGPSYSGLKRVLAVAAGVVVVIGAGATVRAIGGLAGGASSAGGSASTAADAAGGGGTVLSSSGRDYSAAELPTDVQRLVAGSGSPGVAVPEATRATGQNGYQALQSSTLDACVAALTGTTGVVPVAVDTGRYAGKPAVVVVLPTTGDAASLDVWVVGPGCGTAPEPDVLEFQRIDRP